MVLSLHSSCLSVSDPSQLSYIRATATSVWSGAVRTSAASLTAEGAIIAFQGRLLVFLIRLHSGAFLIVRSAGRVVL
jgi:hypothetical protein